MATKPQLRPVPAQRSSKLVGRVVYGLLVIAAALIGAFSGLLLVYTTDLPEVNDLQRFHPSTVTELYDDQGREIGSFALQRRIIASYDDYPPVLRQAIISIEDKDFYQHWGINFWRMLGAAWRDVATGSKAQGGSTLTMQLSRNLFLTPDRNFHRKVQEIMLAIQIERRFTKAQIFTMYANQIYLGHGVYGFEAGSRFYFGKPAKELTIEEAATLAALPKAPNAYSPILSPERALRRRNLVINSMLEDGDITAEQAAHAKSMPIRLHVQTDPNFVAPYYAEEIRQYLEKKYGSEEVHEGGLRVYTTLDRDLQLAANKALLDGLAAYERRHGWKAHLYNVIADGLDMDKYEHGDWDEPIVPGAYMHALVTSVSKSAATVKFGRYKAQITPAEMAWTQHKSPEEILARGDVVYVRIVSVAADGTAKVSLEQDSGAQGSLLALDNSSGDIKAMVGGRDFNDSKFDRATQAARQVGSAFKPFVYTAAIDNGASPSDTVLDAPVTFMTASGPYSPHNYDGKFKGVVTYRQALMESRNIPALRVEQKVGIPKVIEYARKFGITSQLPAVLPLALGVADITLAEEVSAFTTFPNDGVRVSPRFIRKVVDYDGRVLEENYPDVHDVIPQRTARIMTSMLREVVLHGTAFEAAKLKHPLAGKTGTTNDFTDAWFVGFSPSTTCGVWIGYDEKKTLGPKETGAMAALPVWMDFMKAAIVGHEKEDFAPPPSDEPQSVVKGGQ